MKHVIECEGIIYGPFATDREAADWALSHCATPWRSSIDPCHSATARAVG